MANLVTIFRVVLFFVGVHFIYRVTVVSEMIALAIVAVVIALDWVDGFIARRTGHASETGAVLDILADRIVENSLWIVFTDIGLIPIWVPLIVLVRGLITDAIRSLAFRQGLTPFGEQTMMRSALSRALVISRTSRASYAVIKVLAFGALIVTLMVTAASDPDSAWVGLEAFLGPAYQTALALTYLAVLFCLIRGIPVVIDGWHLLRRAQDDSGGVLRS